MRRHLYLIGLNNIPLCKGCGAEDETSAHPLCECGALVSLRQVQLSFSLGPEVIRSLGLGVIWNISKGTVLP